MVSPDITQRVSDFFKRYADAIDSEASETIIESYFDTYIAADPITVIAIANDAEYRRAIEERAGVMHEQLGFRDATIDVESVRELAPMHFIADTRWTMRFEPPQRDPITSTFKISYVVRVESDTIKILMYVSHENEEAVMRRDGVIPAE
jgi:hypothetical protein